MSRASKKQDWANGGGTIFVPFSFVTLALLWVGSLKFLGIPESSFFFDNFFLTHLFDDFVCVFLDNFFDEFF